MIFQNRQEAGKLLGEELKKRLGARKKVVVLGIPRGGVIVAAEVAKTLKTPWGLLVVKKIGAPGNPELAIGAISQGGTVVWNQELLAGLNLSEDQLAPQIQKAKRRMESYQRKFKIKAPEIRGKTVVVVDDGIATGATTEAGLVYLKTKEPKSIILAAPVIAAETVARLEPLADELVYLEAPKQFWAVGQFYQEFEQVTDDEVVRLLREFR